ncbi:diacylglycerol/lipid kinase family protein [Lutimonas sp.]|uniref:diacylglycerol/lipid kinase family protein n=1 Tax=Lutimonas sp. TaxID=1872403 RepID=UPI003D9B19E9
MHESNQSKMTDIWYTIFNPASGSGNHKKRIDSIKRLLTNSHLKYNFISTKYAHHEELLVQKAIKKGYRKFICIGGDGTLHYMVNGVMKQDLVHTNKITIAVIPSGTGNDWIKTYGISSNPTKAIQTIVNNKCKHQDIGRISLATPKNVVFFANTAGIGFDAYVVKNINKYEKWGSLSYIIAAVVGLKYFKPSTLIVQTSDKIYDAELFLLSVGLCKYSGSGMQLTHFKNHQTGFFDITYISKIKRRTVLKNILKLYFGGIHTLKESQCFIEKNIDIEKNTSSFIQADGELIGSGNLHIQLIPNAIQFIVS